MSYVLGLVSGVIVAVVAGYLGIRGQQLNEIRNRQISAADDFGAAVNDVLVSLSARMEVVGSPQGREDEWRQQFRDAVDGAREATHESTRRLARIALLYGEDAEVSMAATSTVVHLLGMTEQLRSGNDVAIVTAEWKAAVDSHAAFIAKAHEMFTSRPLWPRRLRRATAVA